MICLVDSNDERNFSLLTRTLMYVVLQRRVRCLLRPCPDRFSHAFLRAAGIQNRTKQKIDLWSSYTGESQKRKLICESHCTGVFVRYFALAQESQEILKSPLIIRDWPLINSMNKYTCSAQVFTSLPFVITNCRHY